MRRLVVMGFTGALWQLQRVAWHGVVIALVSWAGRVSIGRQVIIGGCGGYIAGGCCTVNRLAGCLRQWEWVGRNWIGVSLTGLLAGTIGRNIGGHWVGDGLEASIADVRLGGSVAWLLIAGQSWLGGVALCWRLESSVLDLRWTGHWSVCGAHYSWSRCDWRPVAGADHHWCCWNSILFLWFIGRNIFLNGVSNRNSIGLNWSSSWNSIRLQGLIIVIIQFRFLIALRQTEVK